MSSDSSSDSSFERRKQDHIRLALDPINQAAGGSGLDRIELRHEALPDLDFHDISIRTKVLGKDVPVPFFVSSMTAGHAQGEGLNLVLARACQARGWPMGVGSQRKQLTSTAAANEWKQIRKLAPDVLMMGNIGISQVITSDVAQVQKLADSVGAFAMIVHTNPLQEVLQPEGTPMFKGSLAALEKLAKALPIPVILKETGCGFSRETLKRLLATGIAAVDVSGYGGTHWGRLEGQRSSRTDMRYVTAQTFAQWGVSTAESLLNAVELKPRFEVWASGGVRSGLDAAKLLAMGATTVGFAKPVLEAALQGVQALEAEMQRLEFELKTALFCTGSQDLAALRSNSLWRIKDGPPA
ncbi:MAG TPA: type 2 isopentenyl-diphosphate Delta-isomerase [Bdellovibrionales bacterium]|nr:type 2 isopentenyl-diphosphate Delta-isomerase [Bdellovibrionales bacterium]